MKFRNLTLAAFSSSLLGVAVLSGCDTGGPSAPAVPAATGTPKPVEAPDVQVKSKMTNKVKNAAAPATAD